MKNSSFLSKGQALVETIIALAVASLIIGSLVVGVVISVKNTRFAKNQSLATKFAQEGMEEVRLYRDQNGWDAFWSNKVGLGNEGPTGIGETIFEKEIKYQDVSEPEGEGNRAKVTVTVSWTEGANEHQSKLSTYLAKWQ